MTSLNVPQEQAASHATGPLLVFAGAGSGKTSSVTHRTARLMSVSKIPPERILLVTFTNKAANEMKERMVPLVGKDRTKRLWAGTFHSIGARILRAHAAEVHRRKDFSIYDESDQEIVVKQIVSELRLDKKFWSAATVTARIQKAKQNAWAAADIPVTDAETAIFLRIWERYEAWLASCNALDFEDLILLPMRLAESSSDLGARLRHLFSHVMVDEFQDTNATQYRLIKALATSRNLAVIGDDDQCIYTWRGANIGNIRDFQKEYPDATVVKLEQNYRSTKRIVACALGVISKSKMRVAKELWTDNAPGEPVEVVEVPTDRDEARFVVARMRSLAAGKTPYAEMTVLYRTHAQSRAIEDELRDKSVPYRIVGGHRFYDRKEVKDVLSYLRLVANPDSDVDLLRIINVPSRGIGATTVKRLGEIAGSRNVGLWAALPIAETAPEIGRKERMQIRGFRDCLTEFGKTRKEEPPSAFCHRLLRGVGYYRMWETEQKELAKEGKLSEADDAGERLRNVGEVVSAIASYEARAAEQGYEASLDGYLQMVSLASDEAKDETVQKVSLMTVHAAKGLEFGYVWIVGMEEGRFPLGAVDTDPIALEEERRLGYVAITRAKKRLWVTHARSRFVRGKPEMCGPSRFLFDMPGEVERSDVYAYEARERDRLMQRRAEQF